MKRWYDSTGTNGDIIISSRIRLARNLAEYPFLDRINRQELNALNNSVTDVLKNLNLGNNKLNFLWTDQLTDDQKRSLIEQHLVSTDFIRRGSNVLALSEDNGISIMINEEDHLRIQVIVPGFDLEKAYETASLCDDYLNERFEYAFDKNLGYLTTCMTNLGTGLRASVMIHLPALESMGALNNIINTVSKLGLTIRGTFGEGTNAYGSIYQISNQITLGISEEQAMENLKNVVCQIVNNEREARAALRARDPLSFEDRIYRSYGILSYARSIGEKELYNLLSDLRLGVSEKIITNVTTEMLNHLLSNCGESTLKMLNQNSDESCLKLRADLVRNTLKAV